MGTCKVSEFSSILPFEHQDAFFRASPPYYSVLLYAFDPAVLWWTWIGTMFYSYKIFLPDLIATMVGIATVFQWTFGNHITLYSDFQNTLPGLRESRFRSRNLGQPLLLLDCD